MLTHVVGVLLWCVSTAMGQAIPCRYLTTGEPTWVAQVLYGTPQRYVDLEIRTDYDGLAFYTSPQPPSASFLSSAQKDMIWLEGKGIVVTTTMTVARPIDATCLTCVGILGLAPNGSVWRTWPNIELSAYAIHLHSNISQKTSIQCASRTDVLCVHPYTVRVAFGGQITSVPELSNLVGEEEEPHSSLVYYVSSFNLVLPGYVPEPITPPEIVWVNFTLNTPFLFLPEHLFDLITSSGPETSLLLESEPDKTFTIRRADYINTVNGIDTLLIRPHDKPEIVIGHLFLQYYQVRRSLSNNRLSMEQYREGQYTRLYGLLWIALFSVFLGRWYSIGVSARFSRNLRLLEQLTPPLVLMVLGFNSAFYHLPTSITVWVAGVCIGASAVYFAAAVGFSQQSTDGPPQVTAYGLLCRNLSMEVILLTGIWTVFVMTDQYGILASVVLATHLFLIGRLCVGLTQVIVRMFTYRNITSTSESPPTETSPFLIVTRTTPKKPETDAVYAFICLFVLPLFIGCHIYFTHVNVFAPYMNYFHSEVSDLFLYFYLFVYLFSFIFFPLSIFALAL